jgi:dienelactone hydrolase
MLPANSIAVLIPTLLVIAQDPPRSEPTPIDAETLALFDYDQEAPFEIEEVGVDNYGDYTVADITYASPAGGSVPAYLYQPNGQGPYAAIVLMHGMPGDRNGSRRFADRYVGTGAVVLAISAPWARPDGPREDIITFTEKDRDEQIQLIQDLRRAVDILESFPWVDKDRIAYVGGSYGGAMGGLLAGVEHRIKAYALMVGDGGLVEHMAGPDGEPGPGGRIEPEVWKAWRGWMDPIEPLRFVAHAAPSDLLFQNGKTDQLVPASDARVYQAAGSEPKTILWYEHGHAVSQELLKDQVKWLAERVGIDATKF